MAPEALPQTSKALVLHVPGQPLSVDDVPTPQPGLGNVIVKVLYANVDSDIEEVVSGHVPFFTYPKPCVLGNSAIARVIASGPDAMYLQPSQLVIVEPFLRARDDPNGVQVLFGLSAGFGERNMEFMTEVWRNALYAEYSRVPLENCHPLNEKILCGSPSEGGLGYDISELAYMAKHMVPLGGYQRINLKAGETVVVAPATGGFSGGAVEVAAALGARVIAVGRNTQALQRLKDNIKGNVQTYQLKGDIEADAQGIRQFGEIDAYLDFSPFAIPNTNHVQSILRVLKPYGRVVFMGPISTPLSINVAELMAKNISIRGAFMYERDDAKAVVKMVESGTLRLGKKAGFDIKTFSLSEWKEAFAAASEHKSWGNAVLLKP